MRKDIELWELKRKIRLSNLKIKRLELAIKQTENINLMLSQLEFLYSCIILNDKLFNQYGIIQASEYLMFIRLLGLHIILKTYKENKRTFKKIFLN